MKKLYLVLIFIAVVSIAKAQFDSTYVLSFTQKFAIPEEVVNGDYVGTWMKSYTWRGGTVTYAIAQNFYGAFSINSSSGLITVIDATKINGKIVSQDTLINLIVKSSDNNFGDELDTAKIWVKGDTSCVFIDYSAAVCGNGKRATPYNDISCLPTDNNSFYKMEFGKGYFIKRGNTPQMKSYYMSGVVASAAHPTIVGAYGAGNRPEFNGSGINSNTDAAFLWRNTPNPFQYLQIYDIDIKNYPSQAHRIFTNAKYVGMYNMKFSNNVLVSYNSDLADIYFYGNISDTTFADRKFLEVINAESSGSWGPIIKSDACGLNVVNIKCQSVRQTANKNFNLRLGTNYSSAKHIWLIGGNRSLQMRYGHSSVTDAIIEGATEAGWFAIWDATYSNAKAYMATLDNVLFRRCADGIQYWQGMEYNTIKNCLFEEIQVVFTIIILLLLRDQY